MVNFKLQWLTSTSRKAQSGRRRPLEKRHDGQRRPVGKRHDGRRRPVE